MWVTRKGNDRDEDKTVCTYLKPAVGERILSLPKGVAGSGAGAKSDIDVEGVGVVLPVLESEVKDELL
jgi:hypothetical protein